MGEMTVRPENYPAILDGYVKQGQMFLSNAAMNLIQYGRVLTEAKPLFPHGKFGEWVKSNFNMSERSAQGYMAVWLRFGENDSFNRVQFSNLQKMLSLPEGKEEQFVQENDLENMTARQVAEAVAKVRQEELDKRNCMLADAAKQLRDAKAKANAEVQDAKAAANAAIARAEKAENAARANTKNDAVVQELRDQIADMESMLEDSQQEYNRLQAELLNQQSAAARGDADRTISEQMTADDFAGAVRIFLGSVAQVPYMSGSFAAMDDDREYRMWDEMLQAVEGWAQGARKALSGKGAVIDG